MIVEWATQFVENKLQIGTECMLPACVPLHRVRGHAADAQTDSWLASSMSTTWQPLFPSVSHTKLRQMNRGLLCSIKDKLNGIVFEKRRADDTSYLEWIEAVTSGVVYILLLYKIGVLYLKVKAQFIWWSESSQAECARDTLLLSLITSVRFFLHGVK